MNRMPPLVCKAFLACRQIVEEGPEISLIGLARRSVTTSIGSKPLRIFACWTSAHGEYQVEVQLQTQGEIVWRDGPPEMWRMPDPLAHYDLKLNVCVIFPKLGVYEMVLLADGEEVARQQFHAQLVAHPAGR